MCVCVCVRNEELLQEWRNQAKIMQERKILEHKQDRSESHRKEEVDCYFLISYYKLQKDNKQEDGLSYNRCSAKTEDALLLQGVTK